MLSKDEMKDEERSLSVRIEVKAGRRQKCDLNAYLAEFGKRVSRPRSAARRWRSLQVLSKE